MQVEYNRKTKGSPGTKTINTFCDCDLENQKSLMQKGNLLQFSYNAIQITPKSQSVCNEIPAKKRQLMNCQKLLEF